MPASSEQLKVVVGCNDRSSRGPDLGSEQIYDLPAPGPQGPGASL